MTVWELIEELDALGSKATDLPILTEVKGAANLWLTPVRVHYDEDRIVMTLEPIA